MGTAQQLLASVTPASGGSSLLTGLVASWKLADLTDATGRGNTLTNNNTATFNTGKIGNAVYVAAVSSQSLSIASNADVAMGDVDFTIGCWAYNTSFGGGLKKFVFAKDLAANREYSLFTEDQGGGLGNVRFSAAVYSSGAEKLVVANNGGNLSTGVWYCVIVWWDATAQTWNISVNNGTTDTNSVAADLDAAGTAAFAIGQRTFVGFEGFFDGRIDDVNIWKRVLTADERTSFYNGGTGVEYPFS